MKGTCYECVYGEGDWADVPRRPIPSELFELLPDGGEELVADDAWVVDEVEVDVI